MPKYSLHEIKSAYAQKKDWEKQFPTIYYFSRPISFYLTYLIIRITENPTHIVWVGFIIGLLAWISFLFISYLTIWPGVILMVIFSILDAVDGNIARVTKKVSYYGKFLDGTIGEIIEGSYFFWLGLGLYLSKDFYMMRFLETAHISKIFVLLGGVVAVVGRLYSNIFQENYYTMLVRKQKEEDTFMEEITGKIQSSIYRKHWWYLLFINPHTLTFQLLILVLCVIFKVVDLFLFLFAIYYFSRMLIMFIFYTSRAQKILS
ncbi:MAG: hypothetical protein DRP68_06740 [Candidatus Omnitrophota bacterium]|nr:MAG: hypothetical protein DRP68_06740 [Candidatus Omnitrophota bacterium]RKY38916.1 MAG: hypothetical protein DRP72_00880 [Candidatus Omnitrophota bacterium]